MREFPSLKRIVLALLFVIASVALAYLLYYIFFRGAEPTVSPIGNGNGDGTVLPNINNALPLGNENVNGVFGIPPIDPIARGGLTATTVITPDVRTVDPAVDASGRLRYYDRNTGRFFRVDGDGAITQLGDGQFKDVEHVAWSPTADEVILEFPDQSNIYYNLDTNKQVTLPKEFEEFDFSHTGDQIAFKYQHADPDRRVLAVANPDGTEARTIEPLGYYGYRVDVDWSPTGNVVATWNEFTGLERQEIGFLGLQNENFKGIVVQGRGLQQQYSPDGNQLLYSTYTEENHFNPRLHIVDANGNNIGNHLQDLNVETFASKCGFSSSAEVVFCGVPKEKPDGFGLVPDLVKDIGDEIVRINVRTGAQTKIAVPVDGDGNDNYAVESPTVSADGSTLIFRDGRTGQLVKLRLQ